jgi:hypothetical protein
LLQELGPRIHRGDAPAETPALLPTGLPDLDRLVGGGFPRGRLSEIAGPPSSGRTSLALALLAQATRAGEVVAVVDVADAFDPASAEAAGVRLERTLWVRAPQLRDALRSTERILEARGFAGVLLDLALPEPRVTPAAWARLARAAAGTQTALVVLSHPRIAGSAAELAIEMAPTRAHFSGWPPLLEGLEAEVALVRCRRLAGSRLSLRLCSPIAA